MTSIGPNVEGDAKDWTPRQALMHALTCCDNWSAVVIVGMKADNGAPHGINATPNATVRGGLFAYGLTNVWDED